MLPDTAKRCPRCGDERSLEDFHKNRSRRDGLAAYCKACVSLASRERWTTDPAYRKRNSELSNRRRLERYASDAEYREKLKEDAKRWWRENDGAARARLRNYGLTPGQYDAMHTAQGGLCAICRKSDIECVDHCHTTGKVRGLLCSQCNKGIGNMKDNVVILRAAIEYLESAA